MSKTKEQILNEQKIQEEIKQMPTRILLEKLASIKEMAVSTKPMQVSFGEDQKWESIWDENELQVLKEKMLIIIRDI